MRILILASGTPNSSLTHRSVALGREFVKQGHSVSMMAPSLDRHSAWKLDQPTTIGGISMIYPTQLRTKSYVLNLLPYVVSATILVLTRKTDVIYWPKPTPANIAAIAAKWLKRTPVVVDFDDLGSEVMAAEGHPAFMWKLVEACEKIAARAASAIIVASRLLEQEYTRAYPGKPIIRVSNGVDPTEFTPASPPAGRLPRIVFFGMLSRMGIVGPLLESLPAVIARVGSDKVRMEVLGDGPKRVELTALAARLGLSDNVTFRGWTRFEDVSDYVARGDIALCVMPDERTTAACSNQKVFQYQALELATIVSRVGDLPLYVNDGEAGLVIPASSKDALSDAITNLILDRSLREKLANNGYCSVHQNYSWSKLSEQVLSAMEKLA